MFVTPSSALDGEMRCVTLLKVFLDLTDFQKWLFFKKIVLLIFIPIFLIGGLDHSSAPEYVPHLCGVLSFIAGASV